MENTRFKRAVAAGLAGAMAMSCASCMLFGPNKKEIVEAARIDGCSEIGIFNRIAIPMLKPALSLLFIFNFVSSWNNSYMQSLVITRPDQKTLALFMKNFVGASTRGTDPIIYMLLVLSMIPPIIVYILFSKSITSRIVIGAVKE